MAIRTIDPLPAKSLAASTETKIDVESILYRFTPTVKTTRNITSILTHLNEKTVERRIVGKEKSRTVTRLSSGSLMKLPATITIVWKREINTPAARAFPLTIRTNAINVDTQEVPLVANELTRPDFL